MVGLTIDQLKEAPTYAANELPAWADRAYQTRVHDYYKASALLGCVIAMPIPPPPPQSRPLPDLPRTARRKRKRQRKRMMQGTARRRPSATS